MDTQLTGSPKQITWAEQIRASLPTAIDAYTDQQIGLGATRTARRAVLAQALTAHAATITDASWWIGRRPQRNETIAALACGVWLHIDQAARQAITEQIRTAGSTRTAADLITALRAAGMTVRAIAAAVGVHTSTVYRWARGLFRPAAHRMTVLAALAA